MPGEEFDDIRTRVLTDNTAQGVLNHLKALYSNRAHVLTRWVWELLQNARDASVGSNTGLCASFEQNQAEIVFRHNGNNFKINEIAHLIYHGSTKIESTETIGQYGSGFLTTHLLSPEIHVSGQLNDDRPFEFLLKREVDSVNDLSLSMEQAWNDFKSSLSEIPVDDDLTTKFRYSLDGDAFEAVEEGIATLKQCAPYVVVFNQEFSSIDVKSPDESISFTVINRESLEQDGLQQVTVEESKDGNRRERKYILAQGEKASVTAPLEYVGDDVECLSVGRTPRLFLGFPLVGTENFSFPAVINSLNFTPTANRDGAYLAQSDDEANIENQSVIEEACKLLIRLLRFAAESGWRNNHVLANVPTIHERDWLKSDWLRECLKEQLIGKIRQNPVVLNEDGEGIPSDDLELPLANTDEGVKALWDLLDGWQGSREGLPRRGESDGWCNAVKSWAKVSECEVSSFNEVTDGVKLASYVHRVSQANPTTHRISRLDLKEGVGAIKWLDQFIAFLYNDGLSEAVRDYRIVPSQERFLRTLHNLHRDCGIHPELKSVASLLEWHIGRELRDTKITSLSDESGEGDWDSKYVVGELIKRLQERAENDPNDNFGRASIRLFAWIVSQESWDLLRGFPVFAERGNSDSWTVIKLERAAEDEVRPLAPVKAWEEYLRPFSELFPQRYTLDNAFFDAAPDTDVWQKLDDAEFLRRDVIIRKETYFCVFLPDKPLTEGENHKTSEYIDVTDIAFLTRADIGIMDRVRQSQRMARIFWRFLTEWLIVHDSKGLEINEALCDCKESHRYYPAAWLEPVVERMWVPRGERRSDLATGESLAGLLRGSGWEPSSLNENPAVIKLLEAINVTHFDLLRAFVAADPEQRKEQDNILTGILAATGGDVSRLNHVREILVAAREDVNCLDHAREYIEDLKNDDALPEVLAERRERRRIVHENQRLGAQVEDLVKESLEGEGFTVRRTGVGSDFEITYNSAEMGDVVRLELSRANQSWLIEVKATRDQDVRMTATQARTAVEEDDRFLLCVVPVENEIAMPELEDVRSNMRFVGNIGPRVTKLCDDLDDLEKLRNSITGEEIPGVRLEVVSGAARVRVGSSVWQDDGFRIEELPNKLS